MPVRVFERGVLDEICAKLADTNAGITGSQILKYLTDLGMADPMPSASKRTRLLEALWQAQINEGSGKPIIRFIEEVMRPIRYTGAQELFESRRHELNQKLAFCEMELSEAGTIVSRARAITLADAQQRADKLRSELKQRNVHPDVLRFCQAELLQENYFHAVFEATKSVADKLRSLTGLSEDGAKLANIALMNKESPHLAINELRSEPEKDEQIGFANLMIGMFGVFRNTVAHAPKIAWPIDEQDALDLLSLVSYMHRRLDAAIVRRSMNPS